MKLSNEVITHYERGSPMQEKDIQFMIENKTKEEIIEFYEATLKQQEKEKDYWYENARNELKSYHETNSELRQYKRFTEEIEDLLHRTTYGDYINWEAYNKSELLKKLCFEYKEKFNNLPNENHYENSNKLLFYYIHKIINLLLNK